MYKNFNKKVGYTVATFTIKNKTYSVRLTKHAELRLKERNIDLYQTIGNILSLGEKRIINYSGSNRDILIQDKENGFSIVCTIELRTIYIITVIDNCDCWVKSGTSIINL